MDNLAADRASQGGPLPELDQINVRMSCHHIEVDVTQEKECAIIELMKETHRNMLNQKNLQMKHTNHRAIVLYEAEKPSKKAQRYIRSLSESYSSHNKVILCCSDISRVRHVQSLCTVIQLFWPSDMEIVEVLEFIARKEDIQFPCQLAKTIAVRSRNSLQQAIRSFEASWQSNHPFNENEVIIMTGWEEELAEIAKDMIEEQSSKQDAAMAKPDDLMIFVTCTKTML
ncbi:hypothetical protein L1049_022250 [Liquidambar formosana]|uniref:Replication factor C subunit 3 n=1 Tax=Liquidambar formosana TaxID=63359 RepID=A0AAP0RE73_LIQFO